MVYISDIYILAHIYGACQEKFAGLYEFAEGLVGAERQSVCRYAKKPPLAALCAVRGGGICGSKWRRGWGRGSVLPNVQCTVYKIRSAGAAVWLQSRFAVCDLADGAQRLRHAVK